MKHAALMLLVPLLLAGCPSDDPTPASGADGVATDVAADAGPVAHPDDSRLAALRRPGQPGIFVDPAGYETDEALHGWIELCLEFVLTLPTK